MPKNERRLKGTNIIFRLTESEKQKIYEQAQAAGLTASEYIRNVALGYHVQTKTDVRVLNELRRLGGLTKHLYNKGMDPIETGNALAALSAAAARLGR